MKNTLNKGQASFLILRLGDRYLGVCKEFGFIEEAQTAREVETKLINGCNLLLKTVSENPRLESSLNAKLPLKYRSLFYIAPILVVLTMLGNYFNGSMQLSTYTIANSNLCLS